MNNNNYVNNNNKKVNDNISNLNISELSCKDSVINEK
jgi:hypothetical protein